MQLIYFISQRHGRDRIPGMVHNPPDCPTEAIQDLRGVRVRTGKGPVAQFHINPARRQNYGQAHIVLDLREENGLEFSNSFLSSWARRPWDGFSTNLCGII